MSEEVKPADVKAALIKMAQDLGKGLILTASVATILGGVTITLAWPFIQDRFNKLFDLASTEIVITLDNVEKTQTDILSELERIDRRALLEINGAPIILPPFNVEAGNSLPIGYSIKRTEDCATNIVVQFVSGALQRVNTSLNYTIPAINSRVSEKFGWFVIDVKIPEDAKPGWYSYYPTAVPIKCDGNFSDVVIPPSPMFQVK